MCCRRDVCCCSYNTSKMVLFVLHVSLIHLCIFLSTESFFLTTLVSALLCGSQRASGVLYLLDCIFPCSYFLPLCYYVSESFCPLSFSPLSPCQRKLCHDIMDDITDQLSVTSSILSISCPELLVCHPLDSWMLCLGQQLS